MLTALCGGVGAARLLRGMCAIVDPEAITAIVNVGDDLEIHGLHVSPDIDTVTYTLSGMHNDATGWGIVDESWRVMDELGAIGGATWFRLGDRDLATHLFRTGRLRDGAPLSVVTAALAAARGLGVTVVPVTDDPVATVLYAVDGRRLSFQEYFVALHHDVEIARIEFAGAHSATAAPGVLEAIDQADRVIIAPSNPVLSIDPILSVPGVRDHVAARRDDVVAVSPIVAGEAIKGPAARIMAELGIEPSALGVARHYRELAGTIVIDVLDESLRGEIEGLGIRCLATETVMRDPTAASALALVVRDG